MDMNIYKDQIQEIKACIYAYNNLRNKRRLTKWLENKMNEMGKDEYEAKLEQEDREIICKRVISKPDSLGVDLISCTVAYERTSKQRFCLGNSSMHDIVNEVVVLAYFHRYWRCMRVVMRH